MEEEGERVGSVGELQVLEEIVSLQQEIDLHRKEIHTDSYQMSVGELANLYRDGDLDLHPEFQRFYRWTKEQKSRWVESILLGIPLPSIFVAQREDGVWDVIDGLQRLSTILEFMGELKGEDGKRKPPLELEETKFLRSLKGKFWHNPDKKRSLSSEQQRFIKRAKLDIKIILRESHRSSKYELFQRLNTGGTFLSDQEVRSCLMISVDRTFYQWLSELGQFEPFQEATALAERQLLEQYDLELATRFVILRQRPEDRIPRYGELGEFLSDEIVRLANDKDFDRDAEAAAFRMTFSVLARALGDDVFRRYDVTKDRFHGPFLISAFEVVGLGLGFHAQSYQLKDAEKIATMVKRKVWRKPDFLTSSGVRATQRLPKTLPFGRNLFAK